MPLLIFLTDILTKWWTIHSNPTISWFNDWIYLTHVRNTGVAFSTPLVWINIIIPLILCLLGVWVWKQRKHLSPLEKKGYELILTGGILNALERLIFGSVTDMIGVKYFAVFNVADIAITSWVILILWVQWRMKNVPKKKK